MHQINQSLKSVWVIMKMNQLIATHVIATRIKSADNRHLLVGRILQGPRIDFENGGSRWFVVYFLYTKNIVF